jgi:hypothetical protein
MIAFLRPVQPQIQLVAASVRISQVEGCNSRVLMNVHTNHLPAGFDYAFHVGNSTVCGDATDVITNFGNPQLSHGFNFSEYGADDNAAREHEARKVQGTFRYGQRARLARTNSDCAPDGAKSA